MLSLIGASVGYGDFRVLTDVTLHLQAGQLHSLIGPNGAGKTTLINALSGHLPLTAGRVEYRDADISRWKADRRARAGIGRSFQKTHLFANLTVLRNVELAVLAQQELSLLRLIGRVDPLVQQKAVAALAQVNLEHRAGELASALSHGDKRKLEMAMLLAEEPQVLLLDEPTAGMSLAEAAEVLGLVQSLRKSGDYAILLVEHKLEAVMKLSDVVTVLSAGEILAVGEPQEIVQNPDVQRAYLGDRHGTTA